MFNVKKEFLKEKNTQNGVSAVTQPSLKSVKKISC